EECGPGPVDITWSIGVGRSRKNRSSEAGSLASKAAVLSAPIAPAARSRRSRFRAVRISLAPSARARRAVSSPMPALPPITTTVCPRSWGSRGVGETVLAVVIASSGGRCGRRSLTWRSFDAEGAPTRTASPGRNLEDLLHAAVGGGGGLLRTVAVLTRAQVGRVPVPPVVLVMRLLVATVALLRLVEELCKGRHVHGPRLRQLPLAAGKPRLDLLEQPSVPVRVFERGERVVGTTLRVA